MAEARLFDCRRAFDATCQPGLRVFAEVFPAVVGALRPPARGPCPDRICGSDHAGGRTERPAGTTRFPPAGLLETGYGRAMVPASPLQRDSGDSGESLPGNPFGKQEDTDESE